MKAVELARVLSQRLPITPHYPSIAAIADQKYLGVACAPIINKTEQRLFALVLLFVADPPAFCSTAHRFDYLAAAANPISILLL